MWKAGWSLLAVLLLTGCAGTKQDVPMAADFSAEDAVIDYVDLNKFDQNLAYLLEQDPEKVTVVFTTPISTHAIPGRMQEWIDKIDQYDGEIITEPEPENLNKSLLLASITTGATLSYQLYKWHRRNMMYKTAEDYNVKIMYQPDSGRVNRLFFERKAGI